MDTEKNENMVGENPNEDTSVSQNEADVTVEEHRLDEAVEEPRLDEAVEESQCECDSNASDSETSAKMGITGDSEATPCEDGCDCEQMPSNDEMVRDENPTPQPQGNVKLVAIPFINDGSNNVQIFYNSMFIPGDGQEAIDMAERYFFDHFSDDEPPKWDGVLLCQFDFDKGEIIKDDRNGVVRLRDFKSKWLWKASGAREDVTFTVKCRMPKVWASHFQSFLREMERYGKIGHSGQISFLADGDGNFRPKFKFTKEFEQVQGIPSTQIGQKAEQMFDAG